MPLCSLIVAMDKNRAIGRGNDLPWHIPEDLKFFKSKTTGKPVIMGRKTFDSILSRIGKPLPGRPNYIITSGQGDRDDVTYCPSLEDAVKTAKVNHPENDEIVIMGGASIYEQALPLVDKMYITLIDAEIDGADAWFPAYNNEDWTITEQRDSSHEDWTYSFLTLERK